jgi:2-polyprenyl-3-methyl-5-hydroxy-6-metoxy-1,4-benzoquinol methylase
VKQTPMHGNHNPDLLALIPNSLTRIVEVGCSGGALAREYKRVNPECEYVGIEVDEDYAAAARGHCDQVLVGNIETISDNVFANLLPADCWIFGDVLEHLHDPWRVLARIRTHMKENDCILACIPNMQHWSVQANLMAGAVFYQDSGLFDRTHIRWFTRTTIVDMFVKAGFIIERGVPRIFDNSSGVKVIDAIRTMAGSLGIDPNAAVNDCLPLQYVVKARPSASTQPAAR